MSSFCKKAVEKPEFAKMDRIITNEQKIASQRCPVLRSLRPTRRPIQKQAKTPHEASMAFTCDLSHFGGIDQHKMGNRFRKGAVLNFAVKYYEFRSPSKNFQIGTALIPYSNSRSSSHVMIVLRSIWSDSPADFSARISR